MHYYKRNIGDYYKKAGRLSILQHGAYTLLIDACYDREQFPTKEQAIEWCWAASKEEIEAVEFILSRFFLLQDNGTYHQKRIEEEVSTYKERAEINRTIALEREAKRRENRTVREDSSTNRAQPEHEPPPNHKPLTINHKPNSNGFKKPSIEEIEEYLKEKNINSFTAEKFFNHYEANGWMRGKNKIKSWKACVNTWVNNNTEQKTEPQSRGYNLL